MFRSLFCAARGLPAICLALLSPLLAGCESQPDGRIAVAPLEITVLYEKQPVADAVVTLASETGDPPSFGRTDANGVAKVTTYETFDGATIGTHSVSVVKQEFGGQSEQDQVSQDSPDYAPGATPPPVVKDLLPKKYALPTTSGLTINVTKGENAVTLDLEK